MANYGRGTGEDYEDVGSYVKYGAALLAGLVALNVGQTTIKSSQKQDIQNQIAACDRRINELRSGFLGNWLNSDQIAAEEKKRAELQNKYENI